MVLHGKSIGIVKNFALLANITTGCNSILIRQIIEKCDAISPVSDYDKDDKDDDDRKEGDDQKDWNNVYINGMLMGITRDPLSLYDELAHFRKIGVFSNQVSFYYDEDDREIRVFSDHGRYLRPVLRVDEGNTLLLSKDHITSGMSWSDMVLNDIIRYVDSNEVEHSLIAMNPSDLITYGNHTYDYSEIHPSAMLGVC